MTQLHPFPTLHDLALEAGAHWDKADPNLGIMQDHYVFRLGELARLIQLAKLPGRDHEHSILAHG